MKKTQGLISGMLIVAVVFIILFQSAHSYEHVSQQLSEKKCHHRYRFRSEITHSHHSYDHCFVCEFTPSHSVIAGISFFEIKPLIATPKYTLFYAKEVAYYYKGSLFLLRAPPVFIV